MMERAYYVDTDGSTFVVKCAQPGKAPVVVGGPFWTAVAAWKDAELRAAESGASSVCYRTAPDYVPRRDGETLGVWVVRQSATWRRGAHSSEPAALAGSSTTCPA